MSNGIIIAYVCVDGRSFQKKKKEKSSTYAMAERKNAYCISIMRVPAKLKEHSKKVQTC
jgi:hypothetical protein